MYTLNGRYTNALITNNLIDEKAVGQVYNILKQPIAKNTQVALMPDGHFGANVPVGMTMRMLAPSNQWRISPTIISGDIGCGMLAVKIQDKNIDFQKLDAIIQKFVPNGFNQQTSPINPNLAKTLIECLSFKASQNVINDVLYSLGSLGGGNHFIELNQDQKNHYWLVIHCGSRHFGTDLLNHHLKIAQTQTRKEPIQKIIHHYQNTGEVQKIAPAIAQYKKEHPKFNGTYAFLTGDKMVDYLADVQVGQRFAEENRKTIANIIIEKMGWKEVKRFDTIHNYFDAKDKTIRKGATSAQLNKQLLIPLNMRDGSLICIGKGNPDWNYSAPHGAGRILSRTQAKSDLKMADFQAEMNGIYTSSVNENTIDEAPDAYKPMQQIIDNITPTAQIIERIKPVYNFKAH